MKEEIFKKVFLYSTHTGYAVLYLNVAPHIKWGKEYYPLVFLATGYRVMVDPKYITQNDLRDPYYPIVGGVGYPGFFKESEICSLTANKCLIPDNRYKNIEKQGGLYKKWACMILRCYDKKYYDYNGYRTVHPRWHSFSNFLYDVQQIPVANGEFRDSMLLADSGYHLNYTYINDLYPETSNKLEISPFNTMWVIGNNYAAFSSSNNKSYEDTYNKTELLVGAERRVNMNKINSIQQLIDYDYSHIEEIKADYNYIEADYRKELNAYIRSMNVVQEAEIITQLTHNHKIKYGFLDKDGSHYDILNMKSKKGKEKILEIARDIHNSFMIRYGDI